MDEDNAGRPPRRSLVSPARRRAVGSVGAGLASGLIFGRAQTATAGPLAIAPWSTQPGEPTDWHPYGAPSPFEKDVVRRFRQAPKMPGSASTLTPLADLFGTITPSGLIYERHHAGIPQIDPEQHRLVIHGLVRRPLELTMDDLVRFPSVTRTHFLECSGNTASEWEGPSGLPVQMTHGLLSCAEWTGVPLATLLDQVGVQPAGQWLLAEGADAAAMTRSLPVERILETAMVVYAQNGERLRPETGYPLRLLAPGFEGNTNVKWLRRLKLVDGPVMGREETSRYTSLLPNGKARQFAFEMDVKSVITRPSPGHRLASLGFHAISGLAWSGRGRIVRVEVSTDAGKTWRDAQLQGPVLDLSLTRFVADWRWDGGPAVLQSRATDSAGHVQPTREVLVAARGLNSYYHYNGIQSWTVMADGELRNA